MEHKSRLDDVSTEPIFALWKHGEIVKVYLGPEETPSSSNLKRGLASIFQYRTLDGEYRERDASGNCNTTYVSQGPRVMEKRKNRCDDIDLRRKDQHPNPILDVTISSSRHSTYELNSMLLPTYVEENEQHEATLSAKPEIGTRVTSQRIIKEIPGSSVAKTAIGQTVDEAIADLERGYRQVPIDLEMEPVACPDSGCRTVRYSFTIGTR